MDFQLLTTAALTLAETSLKQVLAQDSAARTKLKALEGFSLEIHITTPDLKAYLSVLNGEIKLNAYREEPCDASITGSPASLIKLLVSTDKTAVIHGENLQIAGDLQQTQALQSLLADLKLDWEYFASKIIGDLATQQLSDMFSQASNWSKNTAENLTEDLDDYLHHEKRLFPSSPELQHFYSDVDDLNLRVDRLRARLDKAGQGLDRILNKNGSGTKT